MRIRHILALLLFSCLLYGQAHVVVAPASLTPLSTSSIGAAEAALASAAQNTDFDIRIAFMTSASGTGDRFEEYSGFAESDYMAFFNSPYQSSFGGDPASLEAEHQRLLAMGADTLGGGGENAVLIIYTTILNLRDDGTDYDQRKTILYGNNMGTCDQRRFDQIDEFINPPTDFSTVATVAQNDAFLNWYSGNLAQATDPNYIVTGTLLFQGNVYCGGEYIYINDQQEEAVTTQSPNTPAVQVLVNPNHSVPTVNWYDELEDNATIFATKNGVNATLAFYAPTYGQFNEVRAKYGTDKSTSIHVRPVNLQVSIDRGVVETHNLVPFKLTYFNNAIPFNSRGSIDIHLGGSFTGAPDELAAPNENTIEWTPGEDICDEFVLVSSLRNISVLENITVDKDIKIRCPFELLGIETEVIYANHLDTGAPVPPTMRQATITDDTLFIVTDYDNGGDNQERDLVYELKWKDDIEPEEDDFWQLPPVGNEPKWTYAGMHQPTSIHNHYDLGGWSEADYENHFPQDFGSFPISNVNYSNHRARTLERWSVQELNVKAFGYDFDKTVVFLSKNEYSGQNFTTDLLPEAVMNKIQKLGEIENMLSGALSSKILDILPGAKLVPKFEVAYEETRFNSESPTSAKYLENETGKISGTFGIQLSGSGDTDYAPFPPPFGFAVTIPVVGSISGGVGVNFLAAMTPSVAWRFSKPNHLSADNVNWTGSIDEIVFGGEINIGVGLFIDESIPFIEVEGSLIAGAIVQLSAAFVTNNVTGGYDVVITFPVPRFQFTGSLGANVGGIQLISLGGNDPLFEWPEEGTYAPVVFTF